MQSITLNPLIWTERNLGSFLREIVTHMVEFLPANAPVRTLQHCGLRIYHYLRNNDFMCVHKLNKCLRHIYACNPTRAVKQQKINIAVAMYNRKVNGMDCAFKDYNADANWKMYQGWVAFWHLSKFSFENNAPPKCMVSSGLPESKMSWFIGMEFVETRLPARGVKRGRDAAKDKKR